MSTDGPLAGRVAIVSGAGAGLGRAHARTLASLGASVAVNDLAVHAPGRPGSTLAEVTAGEIVADGGRALGIDGSVVDDAERIVARAVEEFGAVDIVVNNAGILRDGPFARTPREAWHDVIDVHVQGSYELTRAAWPYFLRSGFGRVIVTTSAAGLFGTANNASYGVAKMGVVGLMKMLAAETAGLDINVNAIAPLALTAMSSSTGDRERAIDVLADLFSRMPPEQVSQTVAWLCSPECDVTGRILTVGGGRVAEVVVAETPGWVSLEHTWADVRDHWAEITDRAVLTVPGHISDELRMFMAALRA
jgi:NAD(P)-dependent dehydrogenase (short-subunit alcohol dehydrogenase family)